jgi:hypothetical protein
MSNSCMCICYLQYLLTSQEPDKLVYHTSCMKEIVVQLRLCFIKYQNIKNRNFKRTCIYWTDNPDEKIGMVQKRNLFRL